MDKQNINLRAIRISRGLNPKEAATLLGISSQYLSRVENGRQKPSKNTLEVIIQKYQLPLEDAERLRDQYGYSTAGSSHVRIQAVSDNPGVLMPKINLDPVAIPVSYSDALLITSDDFGIVINAGQKNPLTNDIQIVSRIGVSLNHAIKVLEALELNIKKLSDKGKDIKS